MKKGILVILVALMAVAMLATPLVSIVQAKKEVVPFSYVAGTGAKLWKMGEVDVKWTPDYSDRIARGTWRLFNYSGHLGTGTLSMVAIISITHYDNETVGLTTYHGNGNYRIFYDITSGPYGAGTLEGVEVEYWDYNYQRTPNRIGWGNATFHSGTGGFEGVKMTYTFTTPGSYVGEMILP
ncbi:MAG: hypothetical protein ACM3WQ_07040 [Chloroflexota bacterium]